MIDQAAQDRLAAMLATLARHRDELERAEDQGDPRSLDRATLAVRAQHFEIARHCREHGLELPADVPEWG